MSLPTHRIPSWLHRIAWLVVLVAFSGPSRAQTLQFSLAQPTLSGHKAAAGFSVLTGSSSDGFSPTPSPHCTGGLREVFLAAWDVVAGGAVASRTAYFDNNGGARSHVCVADGAPVKGLLRALEVKAAQDVLVTASLGDWAAPDTSGGSLTPPFVMKLLPVAVAAIQPCPSSLRLNQAGSMRIQLSGPSLEPKTVKLQSSAGPLMSVPVPALTLQPGATWADVNFVVVPTAPSRVTFTASDAFNQVQCSFAVTRP